MTNPTPSPLKHIRCVPGDIAPIVFLPGDPGRVKRIAAQMDEAHPVSYTHLTLPTSDLV